MTNFLKLFPEFKISPENTQVADPDIAALQNGNFVVTWTIITYSSTGDFNADIYGQRYDANGNKIGQQFRVNNNINGVARSSSVISQADSSFIVTWTYSEDSGNINIYGQRYDTNGNKLGQEFKVNNQALDNYSHTNTSLNNGGFVVIWDLFDTVGGTEDDVYGQLYQADGSKVGQEFRVNSYTNSSQSFRSVAALADGGFIVIFVSYGQDGTPNYNSYGQRYDANGNKVGQEFLIESDSSFHASPIVTSLSDSRYLIAWERNNGDKFGQIYNLNGTFSSQSFTLNLTVPGQSSSEIHAVTALPNGGFVVTGTSYQQQNPLNDGIYSQEYDANENPVGQIFSVSKFSLGSQISPAVVLLSDGELAVVWETSESSIVGGIFGSGEAGTIAFSQTNYSVNEDGTLIATITLVRTGGSDGDVDVTLTPSNNTASAGEDYLSNPITVSFTPDETSKTVIVPIINDNRLEANETINLSLSNPVGGVTLGDIVNATLTIVDNDNNNLPQTQAIKVSSEFQVNLTDSDFSDSSVASLANGGFIAAWGNEGQIFGQQYDANGSRVGIELAIDRLWPNSITGIKAVISVTSFADGGFVVTWDAYVDSTENLNIYGQRYDASSNPVGAKFQVNTTDASEVNPSVATLSDGGFVVTWESDSDIYGQRYDASSNPVGSEFLVNSITYGVQNVSSVASLDNGGFIVTWASDSDVYGRRYDASGNAVGTEFQVNTSTDGNQFNSAATSLTDGSYVVVWNSLVFLSGTSVPPSKIYGQRYDVNGSPVGTEFLVNTNTDRYGLQPAITSLTNGGFTVTWSDSPEYHNTDNIKSQQYDALSNRIGSEINLNTNSNTFYNSSRSSVAALSNGGFVANWINESGNVSGQLLRPVDSFGVFETDKLARSGYIDGLSFDAVEVGALPIPALYDEIYYLHQYPDIANAVNNGLLSNGYTHFVNSGQYEGRNPSTLYNEAFYLSHNPDVAAAVVGGIFSSGFQHYALAGQQEIRSPSDVFNEKAYRTTNPDIANAISNEVIRSGFEHYLKYGHNEARYLLNYLYDDIYYLSQNPDVAVAVAQGLFQDGFEHYLNSGQGEGRNPTILFDESRYLNLNGDVATAFNNDIFASGFEHYVLLGRFEGRAI